MNGLIIVAASLVIGTTIIIVSVLRQTRSKKVPVTELKDKSVETSAKTDSSAKKKFSWAFLGKSWGTIKGLTIATVIIVAITFLIILPVHSSLTKTKIVSYYPAAGTQTVCIGKESQKVHVKVGITYYEIPRLGRTLKNRMSVSTLGEWPNSETKKLLPVKHRKYGEVLVSSQPNNSIVKLDSDGCIEVKLNLPEMVKTIRGSKTRLQFTKL
ncbi:hypothetical protein BMS3Abin15_00898 [bacterium BMS3Abin15]|nr:hypothetical protein BMS3Abin15_00898 [bacterium BMS3Abin15]HDZ85455.1 hypothetical protein [Candidatus Moranbacteria bacterium]